MEAEQHLHNVEEVSRQRESDRQGLLAKVDALEKDAAGLPAQKRRVKELEDEVCGHHNDSA